MSGGTSGGNIVTEAPAVYGTRVWISLIKQDAESTVPDADLDEIFGANLINNIEDNLLQINQFFSGAQTAIAIDVAGLISGDSLELGLTTGPAKVVFESRPDEFIVVAWKLSGVDRWTIEKDDSQDLLFRRFDAMGVAQETAIRLGNAGDITIDGASFVVAQSSSTFGDGISPGDVIIAIDGQASDDSILEFHAGGTVRYDVAREASTQALLFRRYNAMGVLQDTPLELDEIGRVKVQFHWEVGDGVIDPVAILGKPPMGAGAIFLKVEGIQQWGLEFDANDDLTITRDLTGTPGTPVNIMTWHELTDTVSLDRPSPIFDIGDGTGSPLVAANAGAAGEAIYRWVDQTGNTRWDLRFQDATGDLEYRRFNAMGVFQDTPLLLDVDTGLVTFEQGVSLDSGSPVFSVGDGSGAPIVFLDKAAASESQLQWRDGGVNRFINRLNSSENLLWTRHDGSGVFIDTPLEINVATGFVTFAQGVSLASASPTFALGDGLGSPILQLDKLASGVATVEYANAGTRRWETLMDASEDFVIARYDSGGSIIDNPIFINSGTGRVTFSGVMEGLDSFISRGGRDMAFRPISMATTLSVSQDWMVESTATITLPAGALINSLFVVDNPNLMATILVDITGSDTINGAASVTVTPSSTAFFISDGASPDANWISWESAHTT